MKEFKVPVQSLIDHIKSATDVDPWAKEMAEELLKEHTGHWIGWPECLGYDGAYLREDYVCSECLAVFNCMDNCMEEWKCCPNCGAKMDN